MNNFYTTFENFSKKVLNELTGDESLTLTLSAENTFFSRISNAKIRQITNLHQAFVEYKFIKGNKTLSFNLPFIGNDENFLMVLEKIKESRIWIDRLPEDPYLVRPAFFGITKDINDNQLPSNDEMLTNVLDFSGHLDLAGAFSSGDIVRATINSVGQFHWFKTKNYYLDYSLYNNQQKAVKALFAGVNWNAEALKLNLTDSESKLALMNRVSKKIEPGQYRAFLAPSAVSELLGIMNWGGVSMGEHQRGNGSFKDLWENKKRLSPKFSLAEDFSLGMSPRFNDLGEIAESLMPVITKGEFKNFLTSTRTANEYKVETKFSLDSEGMRSPVVATGSLVRENILKELGTGLYISDLHYLSWSDRETARVTGMTRYACFWVENGEIVSPIQDLRFDESLYNIFGSELIDLTNYAETITNTGSYFEREVGGSKTPGILISNFKFTL
ncbi:MAG: metallopeptidase TldD-related protein [Bacteriovorax sp.]|nr:metallopeptidase TldD-related protein [Bacteriovorax sp.]